MFSSTSTSDRLLIRIAAAALGAPECAAPLGAGCWLGVLLG
jgi:hypothetical protein